ncbi:hypothetical protein F506_00170 [Herbaspirillum hiltneri N3]|uniref:DUF2306 domain-containing protein n=1 Tax=Herbaspirillum hiltneri N3 TaxID=1262470 RepID=A0ABN4HQQ3_9BURK|nr:hypothetical protein [Herbaspirillum hiltneri]AKZ61288.1 hypothetical protein F506_00170 [Herbaspirillum hiltneri N3]
MLGLTSPGIIHTLISLVAVVTGVIVLVREHRIRYATNAGKLYVHATVLTCLTSLGIYQHGGFGKPHVLAIITLLTLAIARMTIGKGRFGRRSAAVEMIAYSATMLFHFIPALTETGTRLPVGAPFFANADDPLLKMLTGGLVLVFLAGATLQVVWLGRQRDEDAGAATPA